MATDPNEVRRCAKCRAPAAVCIRDWQHQRFGIATGQSTRDFCCQACGHRFTLYGMARIIVFGIFALIFAILIIPGALFALMTAFMVWPWVMNPVVPGAAMPPVRFRATEPLRQCAACRSPATCTRVTRKSVNLIPTGTTYGYACTACSKTFDMDSPWGVAVLAMGSALFTVLGLLTVMVGIGILFLVFALIGWGMTVWSIADYLRHPVVQGA